MMKPTQLIDAFRNIRRRIVSFLSIMLTVTMGVSGLLCIFFVAHSLKYYASDFYDATHFKDLEVISSMGVSEDNIQKMEDVEGIDSAEGVFFLDGVLTKDAETENVSILSVTQEVSIPYIVEGRLPETEEECVLGRDLLDSQGLNIGDSITLTAKEKEQDHLLKQHTYTITGTAIHPDYMLRASNNFVLLDLAAFDTESLSGGYMRAYLEIELADSVRDVADINYDKAVPPMESRIHELTDELEQDRSDEITAKAWDEYNVKKEDAQTQLADGRQKLDDAQQELDDKKSEAEQKIAGGFEDLMGSELKFSDAVRQVTQGEDQYAKGLQEIANARAQLAAGRAQLDLGYAQYQQGLNTLEGMLDTKILQAAGDLGADMNDPGTAAVISQIEAIPTLEKGYLALFALNGILDTYYALPEADRPVVSDLGVDIASMENMRGSLQGGLNQLSSASWQLSAGESQYWQGVGQLNQKIADADLPSASARIDDTWDRLKKGRESLDNAWLSYEENRTSADVKLAEGIIELDDGEEEYAGKKSEADQKLAEGREKIEAIEDPHLTVINRKVNEGFMGFRTAENAISGFAMIFVPMFAIVACLVIYSTMSIIIDDEKKQVGALKAMGFRRNEVRNKYLLFGVMAAVLGAILGCLLSLLLEHIVLSMIKNQYSLGAVPLVFVPYIALLVCAPTIITAAVVAWISCRSLLRSSAVGLMNGSEPAKRSLKKSSGKERSLYSHLIVSNIITDLPRVLLSIVVVIGSCLLIGIGLSTRYAFNEAFSRQEKNIYRFDLRVTLEDSADQQEKDEIRAILNKHNITYLEALYRPALYDAHHESSGLSIICADETKLRSYVDPAVDIPKSGILLPEKFMETYSLNAGDTLTIFDEKLVPHEAVLSSSYPFYVGFIAVMSPDAYQEAFDKAPQYNSFYCLAGDADLDAVKKEIRSIDPGAELEDKTSFAEKYKSTKSLFNVVALILVLVSAILSFVITINLNSILVNRRMKELLIMKVNGFSNQQVVGYLLRETMLINLAGIVLGVLLGAAGNYMLIRGIEPDLVKYIRSASVIAWGGSAGLNILFSLIINTISFRKIRHIPLTDITKY